MRTLVVSGAEAGPGETRRGVVTVGNFADGTPLEVPFILMNGAKEGPLVYVEAACHGSEINGLEVIRRLVKEKLDPAKLGGAFIFVPVTNVVAFNHRMGHTPFDQENMNRVWPGKQSGGMSERIAYHVWENCVKQADYVIDLHTGNSTLVPHVVYMAGRDKSREMAKVFGIEVLVQEEVDPDWKEKRFGGKLRNTADEAGKVAICPELGGNQRFEEPRVLEGVRGVLNVAKWLGMIEGQVEYAPRYRVVQQAHLTQVRASKGGALIFKVKSGERVAKGQVLAEVYSPRDFSVLEQVLSPMDGLVIMTADNPVVHTGELVVMMGAILEEI